MPVPKRLARRGLPIVVVLSIAAGLVTIGPLAAPVAASGIWNWEQSLSPPGYAQYASGNGVALDAAGNIYVAGTTSATLSGSSDVSAGSSDAFVAKFDASGTPVWVHQLGSTADDRAGAIAVDQLGNAYVAGATNGTLPGSPDANTSAQDAAFVAKYDTAGTRLWVHQLSPTNGSAVGVGIAVDGSGDAYVTGGAAGTLPGSTAASGAFVAKYGASGTRVWVRQFGSSAAAGSSGITVDVSGEIYVTGTGDGTSPGSTDNTTGAFVAKYSASGAQLWVHQLIPTSGPAFVGSGGIAVDGSGNAYVTGDTTATLPGSPEGGLGAFTAKYDASGSRLWVHQLPPSSHFASGIIAVDEAGNAYVTVGVQSPNSQCGFWVQGLVVAIYDASGNLRSIDQISPALCQIEIISGVFAAGIAVDGSGNAYLTGSSGGYGRAAFLTKLDSAPPFRPLAPTSVHASRLVGGAMVSFAPPASDGGSAITSYTATCRSSNGGFSGVSSGAGSPLQVSGLTNGKTYSCAATATNAEGTSSATASSTFVLAHFPSVPRTPSAVAGNGTATVHWQAPTSSGGSPIIGYVITPYLAGVAQAPSTFSTTATTRSVSNLANGKSYTFRVAARNVVGVGPRSAATNAVAIGTPSAPTFQSLTSGNGNATIHWSAPPSSNGSAVSGYVVTPYLAGIAQPSRTFNSTATTETVLGLSNAKVYSFKIAARNARGLGPSVASYGVLIGAPTPPTGLTATAGVGKATLHWLAPIANGAPITAYVVTPFFGGVNLTPRVFKPAATTQTITGLTAGQSYTFKVAARNSRGTGAQSVVSNAVTPT